jgi:L-ascorbate metabolism protein UlaG (beta-lactamase superfamily)
MTTRIRFLGIAAFEIINSSGQVILIDPCLRDNPVSPVQVDTLNRVDLVLVTHLAADHLGDAASISTKFKCPVVCGPEVAAFLVQQGADPDLMRPVPWGGQKNPNGIKVRAVESHHTSFRQAPDGQYLSGQPLGFVLHADPLVRIYHSGDSALFSDMKLIGELYRPNIGLLCACDLEKEYLESLGLRDHFGNEMSGDEGALAAMWLGLEYAIICHYLNPENREDVKRFMDILDSRYSIDGSSVKPLALKPGEVFEYSSQYSTTKVKN